MMPRLSAISIENMRPRQQRYSVPDSGCRGLYLNVYPSSRKSWSVRYRFDGIPRNLTLDGFPLLAEARKAAAAVLATVARGGDPAADKVRVRASTHASAEARASDTVERLAAQFIEQHAKRKTRKNSWRATEGIFRNDVLPAWGKRSVHEIRRRDVIDLLEGIAADRPVMANRVKAALTKFFGWLLDRDVLAASPCAGIKAPAQEHAREHVLPDGDLRQLWRAAEAIGGTAGACVKLLILIPLRRGEIAGLRWGEVKDDLLVLPAERMKGKQMHVVPLSMQAAALIAAMPQNGEYVWGHSPISHFHRIKSALDAHMPDVPKGWVVHDIRRTAASGMARIGVAVPVIEKILAHRGGTFRGVAGTYQRHSFLPEMGAALQQWADHIDHLVSGKPAKVVKLPRRRA
jgi:integrase